MASLRAPAVGAAVFVAVILSLATYFTFAAVQGDFGLFRRIQIEAERDVLAEERDTLLAELAVLENKTRRLSDDFLDLDLLDTQARDILGLARSDEILLH